MAPIAITPPPVEVKTLNFTSSPTKSSTPKRKIICFSDFDGTIFMQDTGHILFNNFGCGSERRQILDEQIHSGERSFRDVSEEMWGSLDTTLDDGFEVMKQELEIDCDFRKFHKFCIGNDIPFNVISAGLKPVLRRVLDHFLGEEDSERIEIIANDAAISEDGSKWTVEWLHDTELGHDKAQSINNVKDAARQESEDEVSHLFVFIGDGVSDLPAAREADVLFARRGLRLEEYCIENNLPYIPYDTFADIHREVAKLADIDEKKEEAKSQALSSTVPFNPRAALWRRASSKVAVPTKGGLGLMSPRDEKMVAWPDVMSQLKTPLQGLSLDESLERVPIAAPAA